MKMNVNKSDIQEREEKMKRSSIKIDTEFRTFWKRYVFQCLLATIVIFIILSSLIIHNDTVIIASLGATTFIIFAMTKDLSAKATQKPYLTLL